MCAYVVRMLCVCVYGGGGGWVGGRDGFCIPGKHLKSLGMFKRPWPLTRDTMPHLERSNYSI